MGRGEVFHEKHEFRVRGVMDCKGQHRFQSKHYSLKQFIYLEINRMNSFSDKKIQAELRVQVPSDEEHKDFAFNNHHLPKEREFVVEAGVPTTTIGSYVAQRLVEAGADVFFSIPGDFCLGLLDSLLANQRLKMVGCCNELNAGYAADGYCRSTGGLGVLVVTYMVLQTSIIHF